MKFFFYSTSGEGAGIALRLMQEGNDVELFIHDKIYKSVFDNIIPKSLTGIPDKDAIVIFDISGNGPAADKLKKTNKVYGAGKFQDKLESDRKFGYEVMKSAGIKVPEYKEFTNFRDAIAFCSDSEQRLVFKPSGKDLPSKLTYVSKDNNELIAYLDFIDKKFGPKIDSFVLQEFIEGIVISSECFCDGKKFIFPPNHTVEVKHFMDNDLGASTGCSGNITWPCDSDRIINEGVSRLEHVMQLHNMIGQIDLNTVVNEEGVYGLEFTPRFGYDATPTFLTLIEGDYGEFFHNIANGNMKEMRVKEEYAGSIRITIPPYPVEPAPGVNIEKFSPSVGIPIQNYEKHVDDIYFYEVMLDDERLVHSDGVGVVALGIGHSENPSESLEVPYEIAEDIIIPDKQYRSDLRKVLPDMIVEAAEFA